jgi:hypothetical protein
MTARMTINASYRGFNGGCLIGTDQLDPLGEGEPPGPGPGRGVHHPKRSAARMVDRIGQVGMAWSERMGPDPGPEVPDQRPGTWTQHAADLGQAGRRVGPVVHRQGADHQVEGSVGECQGGHVAEDKRWPALVAVPRAVGVGSGASDHSRVQVQAGHVEPVLAGQPDRQVPGSAADLQDLCAVGGGRRDVGRDAPVERAEQEPGQGVS